MQHLRYFTWLAGQAAAGLRWGWPVTLALAVLFVVAIVRARGRLSTIWQPRTLWQLTPLLVPVALLALGTWFVCEHCSPSSLGQGLRHEWAMRVADALLVGQLFGAAWLVVR